MASLLQQVPPRLAVLDLSGARHFLGVAGYVSIGFAGLVFAVWVYFWPYTEYCAKERNIPGMIPPHPFTLARIYWSRETDL